MRTLIPLAAVMASFSVCAAAAQPPASAAPDPAADLAALQTIKAKDDCLVARAKALDDHVSPPEKIAALMKDACYAEEDRALAAMIAWAARRPGLEPTAPTLTAEQRLELAKEAVLMARGHDWRGL